MHEFALADAVMRAVRETADAEALTRVTHVAVEVGELQRIERDVFEFALGEVRPEDDARLQDADLTVTITPARFRCRACAGDFDLAEAGACDADAAEAIHFVPELSHAFLRCPACRSPDFEVVAGRGVSIRTIEGERPDDGP